MRRFIPPSMGVACLALAVALSGTAYAVTRLPANSVGTGHFGYFGAFVATPRRTTLKSSPTAAEQLRRLAAATVAPHAVERPARRVPEAERRDELVDRGIVRHRAVGAEQRDLDLGFAHLDRDAIRLFVEVLQQLGYEPRVAHMNAHQPSSRLPRQPHPRPARLRGRHPNVRSFRSDGRVACG